ncbi:MAG: alpha/beta hydrolase [Parvularcula sp.]|nr:alpha/beta hydrolase [Parvularcula sp.]
MIALEEWRKAARDFYCAGNRIAYWAPDRPDAQKPWLLLIHGFPTSSWDWSALWLELEKHFNLAALDMLGFGLSDKPANIRYSILDQADLQEALLEHLGVSEAHLLVHDYGNTVGQELLARQNDRSLSFALKSLVFLNGGLFPEQHRARPIQKLGLSPLGPFIGMVMTRDKLRNNFDEIFGAETKASDEEIDGHWALINENKGRRVFHKLLQYIPERQVMRSRWVGALKEATIPLRLIDGGADPVSGKHLYDYYREQIPNADAVLLEDIGHYPQTEAPDRVLSAFFDFHRKLRTVSP